MDNQLCEICTRTFSSSWKRSFVGHEDISLPLGWRRTISQIGTWNPCLVYKGKRSSLSPSQCLMCATLFGYFEALDQKHDLLLSEDDRLRRNWVLRLWKHVTKAGIQDGGDRFQIWFEYLPDSRFEIQQLRTDDSGLSLSFNLFADYGSASARFIPRRPCLWNTPADSTFDHIRQWITECNTGHRCFDLEAQNKLPKRVIDVSSEDVYLLETLEISEALQYAALSYCWGDPAVHHQVKTEISNLKSHLSKIDHDTLPRTIRDAIVVCRKLGVDYLWVDALCIVQDDEQDRITEIANMGQIYENAFLTIAASSAKGSDDGFLEPNKCPSLSAPIRLNGELLEAYWVPYGRGLIDSHMYTPAWGEKPRPVRDVEPLHHRGWTFQEALLSKRILLFSTFQPYWICRKSSRSGGEPSPEKFLTAVELQDTLSAPTDDSRQPDLSQDSDSGLKWLHRAENYSRRVLSVLDDKILAIHAVKEQYIPIQGAYFAGVWSNNLAANLLWSTVQRHPRSVSELDRFASAYRKGRITTLPSWSWLSFDGSVRFEVVWHALYLGKINRLAAMSDHIRLLASPQADLFGRLTQSPLRLAGRVKQVLVVPPIGRGWMNRIQGRSCYDAGVWDSVLQNYKIDTAGDIVLEHRIGEAIFDGYTEIETQYVDRPAHPEFRRGEDWGQAPVIMDCLLVSTAGDRAGDLSLGRRPKRYGFKGEGNEVAYGLLLVSEGIGKSAKRRVGLFRGDEGFAAYFDDAQEQEFDLL